MSMPSPALREKLEMLARGELTVDQVASDLKPTTNPLSAEANQASAGKPQADPDGVISIEGATVDMGRLERCGFGEVVFGEGKSAELITRIVKTQIDGGQSAFVTRVDPTTAAQVRRGFDFAYHNPLAKTLRINPKATETPGPLSQDDASLINHVAVVTAGSTDAAVAEEVVETLDWMKIRHQRIEDIGVAGPARLAAAVPKLRLAKAVVVVAGMEGALPSVVGGHLRTPVFAVPTSVGYGANLFGMTALLSMLSSCASNVAVVNIDAGFRGGYLAGLVVSQLGSEMEPF